MTDPTPPPLGEKIAGFALFSGMTSGKSGVDMSTPVHPVATPLRLTNTIHTVAIAYTTFILKRTTVCSWPPGITGLNRKLFIVHLRRLVQRGREHFEFRENL